MANIIKSKIKKVTKAVFPVAGLGTRFLPATKSIPERDHDAGRPTADPVRHRRGARCRDQGIHLRDLAREIRAGGLLRPRARTGKRAARKGKTDLLEILKDTNMDSGAIAYVRQNRRMGLGHAVWCARRLIGNEPFAVLLPDDVIAAEKPCLQQMVEAYAETGGNMVAAMEVPPEKTSSYGVLDMAEDMGADRARQGHGRKAEGRDAPSNLAVIGRYILTPKVLTNLNRMKQGAGGEIQLTDAIAEEAATTGKVYGFRFRGQRYDCGSKIGVLAGHGRLRPVAPRSARGVLRPI